MVNDIVCFTSRYSVGVTFLLWSYHWLCGHETYYRMGKGLINVPTDPNTGLNAHNFDKNLHQGHDAWQQAITTYLNLKNTGPISFYGCTIKYSGNETDVDTDYAKAVNHTTASGIPLVLILESESDPFYFSKPRQFDTKQPFVQSHQGVPQYLIDTLDRYFANEYYQGIIDRDMQMWDLREFIALNYKNIFLTHSSNYKKNIDFTRSHLCLNSKQLWHDGENCIRYIMKYLNKCIDESRWSKWLEVYRDWQTTHLDVLRFGWNLPHIVDAIIHGYEYDLTPLRLDIVRESIIQGHLIDHSLNLRTWQIEKFPNNTKHLHDLLEPLNHG